jgi:nitrate reductase NapE component
VTYTALSASTNQTPSATSAYWRGPGGGTADAAAEEKIRKEKEEVEAKKKKEEEDTMFYIGIGVFSVLVVGILAVAISGRR